MSNPQGTVDQLASLPVSAGKGQQNQGSKSRHTINNSITNKDDLSASAMGVYFLQNRYQNSSKDLDRQLLMNHSLIESANRQFKMQ